MYDFVVRYLARAFVRQPRVELGMPAYSAFATAIGEAAWLPKQVTELLPNGQLLPRLALGTSAGDWVVQITGDSVDVVYSPMLGSTGISLQEFSSRAARYVEGGLRHLSASAHRVAVAQEGLLPQLSPEGLQKVFKKLMNAPPQFSTQAFEWEWRVVSSVVRSFGGVSEPTNAVATVKRVEAQLPDGTRLDRLFVSTDLNTSPKSTVPRLQPTHVAAFVTESAGWHAELFRGLLDFAEVT